MKIILLFILLTVNCAGSDITGEEIMPLAKAVWAENGIYWNNDASVVSIAYVIINRRDSSEGTFAKHMTIDDVLNSGEIHGVGNGQYRAIETLLDNGFQKSEYERKAWVRIFNAISRIAKGVYSDPTDGALFFDHMRCDPLDLEPLAQKGRVMTGESIIPYKYIELGNGRYLYFWK
jgi:hypothetical protein